MKEAGFTLTEALVSMFLFSFTGLMVTSVLVGSFRTLGTEQRLLKSSLEMKNAIAALESELRASSAVSPYLPAEEDSTTTCASALSVSSITLRFLTVEDDEGSSSGISAYYVGYRYDPLLRELQRGEIKKSLTTNCTLPSGDPLAPANRKVIASNIVRADTNGDGIQEPFFSREGDLINIAAGVEVGGEGRMAQQYLSTAVFIRTR